jgi:hypothetical protein
VSGNRQSEARTYTPSEPLAGESPFVCTRCGRRYAPPIPGGRPIRCECGWWYYHDGAAVREVFWPRFDPYREPPNLRRLFAPKMIP